MVEVFCVGCRSKVESFGDVEIEDKVTSRGVKRFLKTTCAKGHKVCNVIGKGDAE